MSDLPLPSLPSNSPENLLSYQARQRIARSFLDFERIRKRARSNVHLSGYWDTPKGWTEIKHADFEAARAVLLVEAEEFGKLGLPHREFREIIRTRIEACVYSLEFSNLQRDSLEADFLWPLDRGQEAIATGTERSILNPPAVKRLKTHMRLNALTQAELADKAKIGERTVRNVFKNCSATARTWAELAKAINTTPEDLLKES